LSRLYQALHVKRGSVYSSHPSLNLMLARALNISCPRKRRVAVPCPDCKALQYVSLTSILKPRSMLDEVNVYSSYLARLFIT
jgi:hypothetical protein